MVEISKKSIMILNKVFCGDKYKLNIFPKSFFDYKETDFDIIMGNPPYNPPKKEGKSTGNSIWQHFVMKSFYMLKEKGYLVYIHPPGWKKPTNEIFKEEQFLKHKDQVKMQVRQGQVWQVLKDKGNFSFIYTNDQKSKQVQYINHFPAVDFYVYQKGGKRTKCDTKNVFNGQVIGSKDVDINYDLQFLPNLLTDTSINIFNNVIKNKNSSKKLDFKEGMRMKEGFKWKGEKIKWYYDGNKKGFQFQEYPSNPYLIDKKGVEKYPIQTVDIDKVILNYGGGIDGYNVKFIKKTEKKGVLWMCMFYEVNNHKEGVKIEKIFSSDLIKFIFHITQYSSGKMTKNEPIVANSISIPEGDIDDIYKYYGINTQEKKLIDEVVNYTKPSKRTPKKDLNVKNETVGDVKGKSSKPTAKDVYGPDPKYEGQDDPAPVGMEPEPMKEPEVMVESKPMKEKKPEIKSVKKSKCSKIHPEGKECCYKNKVKKASIRKRYKKIRRKSKRTKRTKRRK